MSWLFMAQRNVFTQRKTLRPTSYFLSFIFFPQMSSVIVTRCYVFSGILRCLVRGLRRPDSVFPIFFIVLDCVLSLVHQNMKKKNKTGKIQSVCRPFFPYICNNVIIIRKMPLVGIGLYLCVGYSLQWIHMKVISRGVC